MNVINLLKTVYNEVKRAINKILGFFPSKIPTGAEEFEKWAKSIIDTYKPAADARSVRFVLSGLLMRLEQTEATKCKRFFALCLHRAAAGQVGAYKMEDIKNEQKKEYEEQLARAAQLDQPVAATTPVVPTDGKQS